MKGSGREMGKVGKSYAKLMFMRIDVGLRDGWGSAQERRIYITFV